MAKIPINFEDSIICSGRFRFAAWKVFSGFALLKELRTRATQRFAVVVSCCDWRAVILPLRTSIEYRKWDCTQHL